MCYSIYYKANITDVDHKLYLSIDIFHHNQAPFKLEDFFTGAYQLNGHSCFGPKLPQFYSHTLREDCKDRKYLWQEQIYHDHNPQESEFLYLYMIYFYII